VFFVVCAGCFICIYIYIYELIWARTLTYELYFNEFYDSWYNLRSWLPFPILSKISILTIVILTVKIWTLVFLEKYFYHAYDSSETPLLGMAGYFIFEFSSYLKLQLFLVWHASTGYRITVMLWYEIPHSTSVYEVMWEEPGVHNVVLHRVIVYRWTFFYASQPMTWMSQTHTELKIVILICMVLIPSGVWIYCWS